MSAWPLLENKYWQCLKYADQYADAWAISSSHTENFPRDNWTWFESSTYRSQRPSFCVDTWHDGDWTWWKPTHMFTRKTTDFLSLIQPRSHDDHFPIPLWETWFCQSLGVLIPALLENPRQCPCRQFSFDHYGDHIQTCHRQSPTLPAHEWIVYRLSLLLRSVGHRVKTHRITPDPDNERGDIEIQDYVFLPRGKDDRLPPRTLVMDVTMTHDRYGRTTQHTNGTITHRYPPPVFLSLMVSSTRKSEWRFGIIVRYTRIGLIPSCSCLSP